MQQQGKERSKGAAKKGKPGEQRGRNNAQQGSQGDDDMELVGALMRKCLNPLTEGARSGRTTNFLALLGTAEDIEGMTGGCVSSAMETERCAFLCSYTTKR